MFHMENFKSINLNFKRRDVKLKKLINEQNHGILQLLLQYK